MVYPFDRLLFFHVEVQGEIKVYRKFPIAEGWPEVWTPWVTVKQAGWRGRGVFAARGFRAGMIVGRYTGFVMGLSLDPRVQADVEASHSTMIMTIGNYQIDGSGPPQSTSSQTSMFGRVVCEPSCYPGMFCHVVNSCFDLHAGQNEPHRINCAVTLEGFLEITKDIGLGTELLYDYGDNYHNGMLQDFLKVGWSSAP